jgi:hypothetical protein
MGWDPSDVRWWGTLVDEKGLFSVHPRDSIPHSQVIVCFQSSTEPGGRKFALIPTIEELQLVIASYPHCYEEIRGEQPQKLYFDIDVQRKELMAHLMKTEQEMPDEASLSLRAVDLAWQTVMAIITIFQEVGVDPSEWRIYRSISRSNLPSKGSCHLILSGRQGSSAPHLKKIAAWTSSQLPDHLQAWMDPKVYKSLQQFRFLGCCKAGDDRYKGLVSEWQLSDTKIEVPLERREGLNALADSMIGYFDEYSKRHPPLPEIPSLTYAPAITYEIPTSLLEVELSEIIELVLEFVPGQVTYVKEKPPFLVFKRIATGYCVLCERPHEHENPFVLLTKREIRYYCSRHPRDCWLLGTLPEPEISTVEAGREVGGAVRFKLKLESAPLPKKKEISPLLKMIQG